MANLIITYWRDIPSAVSVKAGRKEEKRMLDNRFMEAIDMAAMRSGSTDTDSYLADWRRSAPVPVSDDLAQAWSATNQPDRNPCQWNPNAWPPCRWPP